MHWPATLGVKPSALLEFPVSLFDSKEGEMEHGPGLALSCSRAICPSRHFSPLVLQQRQPPFLIFAFLPFNDNCSSRSLLSYLFKRDPAPCRCYTSNQVGQADAGHTT